MAPWSTACLDWEERIVQRLSLTPFEPLFPESADQALAVFDALQMVDAGTPPPTMGEVTLPWARDFAAHIFGSYEQHTGIRHITEYFMLISKKNGKSTDAAAIMLTALILNWRHEAEFLILSPTIEIAKNSFEPAAAMVRADPELQKLFLVQDHVRTITHRVTKAKLKVVAADSNTVSGKKASGVLIDELWLFGKMPNAEKMLNEATGGLVSRPEGFVIYLTTQSDEPPAGVFKSKLEYARQVRDGKIDDNKFLPVLYEFPRSYLKDLEDCQRMGQIILAKIMQPDNYYITNPNLNLSVNPDYIERKLRQSLSGVSDEKESIQIVLAKHLNVQIGQNLMADRWSGADYWQQQGKPERVGTLKQLLEQCEVVAIGIDGGGLDDLLGLSVTGRCKEEEPILIPEHIDEDGHRIPAMVRNLKPLLTWQYAWAHPSVLERRKDIASKLHDFARAKQMTLVAHIGQDLDELAQIALEIYESGLLYKVGLDPALINLILDALLECGIPEEIIVTVNQGWRLAGAIKATERRLAEGTLIHGGTDLMAFCVGNARVKVVGNAIVITKQVSGTAKIDPLMACFNSNSLMFLNPPSQINDYNIADMVIGG